MTILARGSGATLVTALTASPKAKDLFQQVWVTNGAGVFQNKSLEMANTENKVKEGRIDTLLFSTLNFFTSKIDLWLFFISVGSMTCEMWSKKNKNELFGSVLPTYYTEKLQNDCHKNIRIGYKSHKPTINHNTCMSNDFMVSIFFTFHKFELNMTRSRECLMTINLEFL